MPGMHWQINDDEGVDDDIQYENNAVFSWHVMYHEDGTYLKRRQIQGLKIWNIQKRPKCENNMAKICIRHDQNVQVRGCKYISDMKMLTVHGF